MKAGDQAGQPYRGAVKGVDTALSNGIDFGVDRSFLPIPAAPKVA
jgi:hypothetical protein